MIQMGQQRGGKLEDEEGVEWHERPKSVSALMGGREIKESGAIGG